MLGDLPGFIGVGEIGRIWDTALLEDRDCSCGEPFHACPFWSRVGAVGFGGWEHVDGSKISRLREAVRLRRSVNDLPDASIQEIHGISARHLVPYRVLERTSQDHRSNVRRYAALMGTLYRAVADVAGARVVVDSMKFPYHVRLLPHVPGVDLRFAHLVRDSRGVAHSQTKTITKQGPGQRYRRRRHPARTALRWDAVNLAVASVTRHGTPSMLVRYEDLIARPRDELRRIASFAGESVTTDDLAFVRDHEIDLTRGHVPAGNRMRMEAGTIELRPTDGWTRELPRAQRIAVTTLTWPLIRRYGYVGRDARVRGDG
jgi:hypothetical protein